MQFIYKAFDRIILELIEQERLLDIKRLNEALRIQKERSFSLFYAFQLAGGDYRRLLKAIASYFDYGWSAFMKESELWKDYPAPWLEDELLVYEVDDKIHVYCCDPFVFTAKYSHKFHQGKEIIPCLTDVYRLKDFFADLEALKSRPSELLLDKDTENSLGNDYWLSRSIREGYSDLFVEAQRWDYRIRARQDTHLLNLSTMDLNEAESWIRKIQIRSGMDTISRSGSQDGSLLYESEGQEVLVRVSSVASSYGVDLSLRFFYEGQGILALDAIGLSAELCQGWRNQFSQQSGCVLIGGSTGSGKTTTAYALLNELDPEKNRIVSIEDPIERVVSGWVQIPVAYNTTFMDILKSTLRHDPDTLFIGEIRDSETANVCINASLSGHLVISTMHISGVADVIHRLQGWKLDRATIAEALVWVLAQRLQSVECAWNQSRRVQAHFESLVFDKNLKSCFADTQNPSAWKRYIKAWR